MSHMFRIAGITVIGILLAGTANAQGSKPLKKCPVDSVPSGTVCMDKYEASVWRLVDPLGVDAKLVKKIQSGKITEAELTEAGATQLGVSSDDLAPCTDDGQTCVNDLFAVSIPGVVPTAHVTWFQAQQACTNTRKRLPTNAEWQAAAAGTPDPGSDNGTTDCNTGSSLVAVATGSRSGCVASSGAVDMVGNLWEWVADWVPKSTAGPGWGVFSGDFMFLSGASTTATGPGALLRGGRFTNGASAGPLAIAADFEPSDSDDNSGFRCAR